MVKYSMTCGYAKEYKLKQISTHKIWNYKIEMRVQWLICKDK